MSLPEIPQKRFVEFFDQTINGEEGAICIERNECQVFVFMGLVLFQTVSLTLILMGEEAN